MIGGGQETCQPNWNIYIGLSCIVFALIFVLKEIREFKWHLKSMNLKFLPLYKLFFTQPLYQLLKIINWSKNLKSEEKKIDTKFDSNPKIAEKPKIDLKHNLNPKIGQKL
jgi:hypothetical protein